MTTVIGDRAIEGSTPLPYRKGRGRSGVLLAATVAMGLIAGFFYAYACSVMIGLAETDDRTFITTMQAINATVRNAAFAPSFFGALLLTGMATGMHAKRHDTALLPWLVGAFVLYGAAFVITMGVSVPLNNELADAGRPDFITDLRSVRTAYEVPWVRWNMTRTALSMLALGCLVKALLVRRRLGT